MNQKVWKGILRWQPRLTLSVFYFKRIDLGLRTLCFWSKGLSLFLIRIWVTERSDVDRVPCPLHKHFLVWFQVSLSVGGFVIEGLECPVIQSPSCHSGADARAVSWISIPLLIHSHLQVEMVNLFSGTQCLNLSSLGCLLPVHFSGQIPDCPASNRIQVRRWEGDRREWSEWTLRRKP